MLDRKQLRQIHGGELPLHILEQDYIQALFLTELYREVDNLVFKGGTFLKHVHGLDRFSEDLDFTLLEDGNIEKNLKEASTGLEDYGVKAWLSNAEEDKNSFKCRLRYQGPLYTGSEKSVGSIEVEVSKREDIFLETDWFRTFFEYPETRVVNTLGMKKKELLAEKLRALSMRTKARDLYDVWFFLKQGTELDADLFAKKMEVMSEKAVVEIGIGRDMWENELSLLMVRPPKFEKVRTKVEKRIRESDLEFM